MTDEYIAGFFDGEGNVQIREGRRVGEGRRVELEINNTHRETLVQLRDALGFGVVSEVGARLWTKHTLYRWRLYRQRDIHAVLTRLVPHLIQKKERVITALDLINKGE